MDQHCKDCVHHHNAGHPKISPAHLHKYNDWCVKVGEYAPKSVGHCKNKNLKSTVAWYDKPDHS